MRGDHADGEFAEAAPAIVGRAANHGMDPGGQAGAGRRDASFQIPVEHDRWRINDGHAVGTAREVYDDVARALDRGGWNWADSDLESAAIDPASIRGDASHRVGARGKAGARRRIAGKQSAVDDRGRGINHRHAVRAGSEGNVGRTSDPWRFTLTRDDANGELASGAPAFIRGDASHDMHARRQTGAWGRIALHQGAIQHSGKRVKHRHAVGVARQGDCNPVGRALKLHRRHWPNHHIKTALVRAASVRGGAGNRVNAQGKNAAWRRNANHSGSRRVRYGQRIIQDCGIGAGRDQAIGRALNAWRIDFHHRDGEATGILVAASIFRHARHYVHAAREEAARGWEAGYGHAPAIIYG